MAEQTEQEIQEEIRREHEELRHLLGTVRRAISSRLEGVPRIGEMIASLAEHIETHFQEEEVYGLFDQIVDQAPRLAGKTDELRAEHVQLLGSVGTIVKTASGGDGSDGWWTQLDKHFLQFSKDLMHHESKENE